MKKIPNTLRYTSFLSILLFSFNSAHADVAGNVGKVRVYGALVESACRLEMSSVDQSVDLGNVQTADLKFIGDKAKSTPFEIQLVDCVSTNTNIQNYRTDTHLWSSYQPGFKIRFLAPSAPGFPNLVRVHGAQGLGLLLSEEDGAPIDLGTESKPLLVTPPQETFRYWVTPIRIANLEPNAFQSIISFEVIYE